MFSRLAGILDCSVLFCSVRRLLDTYGHNRYHERFDITAPSRMTKTSFIWVTSSWLIDLFFGNPQLVLYEVINDLVS